jgi:hypothetical protein
MAISNIISSYKSAVGSNFNCYFLPKAMFKIIVKQTILANGKSGGFSFDYEKIMAPDPNHRYYLRYNSSIWTDDTVKIEFAPEGYLKRIETVTDDKTAAIVEKLAELGSKLAEAAAMIPEFVDRDISVVRTIYAVAFDPFNPMEMQRVNEDLASIHPQLSVEIRLIDVADKDEKGKVVQNFDKPALGIYCKPIATAEFSIKTGVSVQRDLVTLPHPFKVHLVEITRPRFIKATFSMDFEMGYPKTISIQRPSQLLTLLESPIKVLSTIMAIPSKLIQLRINLSNDKSNQANSQTQLQYQLQQQLDAQKGMAQMQQELAAMKAQNGGGGTRKLAPKDNFNEDESDTGTRTLGPKKESPKNDWIEIKSKK